MASFFSAGDKTPGATEASGSIPLANVTWSVPHCIPLTHILLVCFVSHRCSCVHCKHSASSLLFVVRSQWGETKGLKWLMPAWGQKKIKKGNVCEEKFCGKTDYILDLICVFKMAKHAITPFSLRRVALKQFSQLVHPVWGSCWCVFRLFIFSRFESCSLTLKNLIICRTLQSWQTLIVSVSVMVTHTE